MTQEELGRSLFRKLADETAFRQAFKANPTKILPPEANRPMEPAVSDKDMALDQAAAQAAQASPTSGLSEGPRLPGYNPLPPVQPPLKDFLGSLPPTGAARPIPYTPDDPTPAAKGGMSPTTWAILGALGLTAGGVGGYMLANQGNSEDEEEEKKKKPDVENNELDKKSSEELGRQLFRKLATPDQPNPGAAGGVAGAGLGTAAILGLLGTSLGVGGLGAGVGGLLGGARKRDDEGLGEAVFRGAGRGAFSGVGAGAGLAAGGMLGAGLASNAQDPRLGALLGLLGAAGGAGLGGYLGYKGGEAFTGDGTTPSKAKPKEV